MKYHVTRQHLGDKMYFPGDTREASESQVGHLVKSGVLTTTAPKRKAERTLQNKAEDGAPENKTDFEAMTLAELTEYAETNDIDLGDATRKADIIAAIEAAGE